MVDWFDLFKARYGTVEGLQQNALALQEMPDLNATVEGLLSHRSVRAYTQKPLPTGTLEILIAAAQSAASSSNLQTWSAIAIEDPARKARLSALAGNQAQISQCPLFLVWLADLARLSALADQAGLRDEGLNYLEMFVTAVIDAALAAQNAVVAAESLGLSTVYIGAMRNQPDQVASELGLPPKTVAVFGLCVGYADLAHQPSIKPRLPQSVVLHREQYDLTVSTAVEGYDQVMAEFYQTQQMAPNRWSEHSVQRIASSAALGGRDRLREILHGLGFELR